MIDPWSPADFVDIDRSALERRPGVKWQRYGPGVLPLWVADMDYPVAPMVAAAIKEQLATGDLGYPSPSLRKSVATAFADRMSNRFDWLIDPADVRVTQDVIQAMQVVLMTCTEPGDGVVMQTPIYHPFLDTITAMDRPLVDNPWLRTNDSWELDIEGLRAVLDRERCRAFILCNPHNPTGRVMTRDELTALGEVAVEYDLVVISDEIHADLVHPGHTHIPFASLSIEVADRTITLNAPSKSFNLAGLKMAVAHTTSEYIADRLAALPGHLLGGINTIGMRATLAVWRDGDDWLEAVMTQLTSNRDLLSDLLAEHIPDIVFRNPEATYLGLLDCRALDLGQLTAYKYFLENAKVAMNAGEAFGTQGAGHVRLNFATSPALITEAVEEMAASLKN